MRKGDLEVVVKVEVNSERVQIVEEVNEVLKRPPKSVNCPCSDHVELPGCSVIQHLIEGRAPFAAFGTTNPRILVHGDNGPLRACGDLFELDPLIVCSLLFSAYPYVERNSFGNIWVNQNRRFLCWFCDGGQSAISVAALVAFVLIMFRRLRKITDFRKRISPENWSEFPRAENEIFEGFYENAVGPLYPQERTSIG
jgi:hypothetical protein